MTTQNDDCLNKCLTKFEYKKLCDIAFQNMLGTCWYNSILSILLFSDAFGERFQKSLFQMDENTIVQKVEELKTHQNPLSILKYSDLNPAAIKEILLSIKRRLCKRKCDYEIKTDIEEESKCVLIHRRRHLIGNDYDTIRDSIGMRRRGTIYLFNTFTKIVLNELYFLSKYNYDEHNNNIGYIIRVDNGSQGRGHLFSVFKCDGIYLLYNDDKIIKILNIDKFLKDIKTPNTMSNEYYTLKWATNAKIYTINKYENTTKLLNNSNDIMVLDDIETHNNIHLSYVCSYLYYISSKSQITYAGNTLLMWSIIHNNTQYIDAILNCDNIDEEYINYFSYNTGNALLIALIKPYISMDTVNKLIDKGANYTTEIYSISRLLESNPILTLIIPNKEITDDENKNIINKINFILGYDWDDVNRQNSTGNTPLLISVRNNHVNIVETLLTHSADPNISNKKGETPLSVAINIKNVDTTKKNYVIQLLQNYGATVQNQNDKDNLSRWKLYMKLVEKKRQRESVSKPNTTVGGGRRCTRRRRRRSRSGKKIGLGKRSRRYSVKKQRNRVISPKQKLSI